MSDDEKLLAEVLKAARNLIAKSRGGLVNETSRNFHRELEIAVERYDIRAAERIA